VRSALELLRVNAEVAPALYGCDIVRGWRGWRPTPDDRTPVLGHGSDPRIVVATGFIGLGMTMAPATAEAIAQLVFEGASDLIPAEFSPMRGSA
jgi:glycine/D-amino acid oxidase-like deaminating enzyme